MRKLVTIVTMLLSIPIGAAQIQLNNKTFTLPDGFHLELVAATPSIERPIVADFDELGRLYVAEHSGTNDNVQKQLKDKPHRIIRLEDTDNDGRFDKRVIFADKMMFPEGAMWHEGSLYVAAPPSIWKLTDTDDDGVADQRTEWFGGKTLTGCANDLHGPYLGLDGMIYWTKGAFAKQEYTLPNGKKFTTRAAHIFRATPDGKNVEPVMTGGMDNPVEVAFTPAGERIFTTTFFQHPGGGRRDGLVHAVYGGVYGKIHDVIDDPSHPRTSPDVLPVLSHMGPAAPSGLYRYESQAFGPDYQDNLFAAAFNLQKITRHVLTPDVATFKSADSDFLVCDHKDFHPTDVLEDADGSLLVFDTGGWYKLCCPTSQLHKPDILGAIYRIRRKGAHKIDDPRGLNLAWGKMNAHEVATLLGDPRPAVRRRAIATLARFPVHPANADRSAGLTQALERQLKTSPNQVARANAVWAATRIDSPAARALVRQGLLGPESDTTLAALHSIALWRDKDARLDVLSTLASGSPRYRRAAAEALGRIGDPQSVPWLLRVLRGPTDRALEHSLIYAVIEIGDADAVRAVLQEDLPHPAVERAALIALDQLGQLKPEQITAVLTSPAPALRDTAAWIAARHPDWGDALAEAFRTRLTSADLPETDRPELQRQLAKLAKSQSIHSLLAQAAGDPEVAADRRRIALAAMADVAPRDPPKPWLDSLNDVLLIGNPELTSAAAHTLRRLNLKKEFAPAVTPALLQAASRTDLPTPARLDVLAAFPTGIGAPPQPTFEFLLAQLAPDGPVAQRIAAAEVIAKAKLSTDQLKSLTPAIKSAGPLEIEKLLTPFENASDEATGLALIDSLTQAKSLTSLRPDSLTTKIKRFPAPVQAAAAQIIVRLNPDSQKQQAMLEQTLASLPAGDVRRGQAIFNSPKAACATCHAIGYLGGTVGPDLTRIGAIRQERDLLESILFPSASFVQSYEPVIIEMADDVHNGVLRKNDANEVILATGAGAQHELRIARSEIKSQSPGQLSIMPAGLDQQLTKQELADLLAFLNACR